MFKVTHRATVIGLGFESSLSKLERYAHLNADFQRIARRDKKAFLSEQYKEIEKNNRTEKTKDFFKKIRDIKGTFHAKVSTIKGNLQSTVPF